jgi:hypothetical protein
MDHENTTYSRWDSMKHNVILNCMADQIELINLRGEAVAPLAYGTGNDDRLVTRPVIPQSGIQTLKLTNIKTR